MPARPRKEKTYDESLKAEIDAQNQTTSNTYSRKRYSGNIQNFAAVENVRKTATPTQPKEPSVTSSSRQNNRQSIITIALPVILVGIVFLVILAVGSNGKTTNPPSATPSATNPVESVTEKIDSIPAPELTPVTVKNGDIFGIRPLAKIYAPFEVKAGKTCNYYIFLQNTDGKSSNIAFYVQA